MRLNKYFLLINTLLIIFGANAQESNIGIGQWRVHLANTLNTSVEQFNGKTYASTEINAFSVDQKENSVEVLSRPNGLSDVVITKIRAYKEKNLMMYAYSNGNIDIFTNNTYINISDIKRKFIVGSKYINDIVFWKNYAYLCCDFGICVVDLDKYEIKETYENLSNGGTGNKIRGCAFSANGDSIFLATENGLMVAKNHFSVNLMDFNNWHTYGATEGLTQDVKGVVFFNSKIYTVNNTNTLLYKSGNTFIPSALPMDGFRSLRVIDKKLVISKGYNIVVCTNEKIVHTYKPVNTNNIIDAIIDSRGYIWAMDYWGGLSTNNNSPTSTSYYINPDGPETNLANKISSFDNSIIVTIGGYKSNYNAFGYRAAYYLFDNYTWKNYTQGQYPIPYCQDLINSAYNPVTKKTYFSSFGYGLLASNNDNSYTLYDDTLGPFPRMLQSAGPYVFVTHTAIDKSGKVWVCNASVNNQDPTLHALNTDGTWFSKSLGTNGTYPVEILIDDNDNKWIRIRPDQGGGIIVYNDQSDTYRLLTDQAGSGSLATRSTRAIAKDLNGDIWVATDRGISIFYNPKNITISGESTQPIFEGFPLLYNQSITCIEVDEGNRKWIGTQSGLWLLSDDGMEVIHYFNVTNSPILSNYIVDIEINDITGEVFIATDKGLISYRGDATTGNPDPQTVKVFPNPIKTGYNGTISISGLSRDAEVKITDIFGTLIYQTIAEGGTAVWNGRNYNGKYAEPGVYLIFSASADGKSGVVGKLAVE